MLASHESFNPPTMTTLPEPSDSGIHLPEDYEDMSLTLDQQFELDKFTRVIDKADSKEKLRAISKQLLKAWFVQRAAVNFVLKQKLQEVKETYYPDYDEK
jgi:hypothetical protein